jgi:hypothetical protein
MCGKKRCSVGHHGFAVTVACAADPLAFGGADCIHDLGRA